MKNNILILLFSILAFPCFSQEINQDPFDNRIIQKYYTRSELKVMAADYPEKFKQIKYQFIHSFIIDETSASNCESFNPSLFDVSEYESLRPMDRQITIEENSCGVRITLLSKKELEELIQLDGQFPGETNPNN